MVSNASVQQLNMREDLLQEEDLFLEDDDQTTFQSLQGAPVGELHLRFFIASGKEFALPAIAIREVLECSPDRINPMPNVSPLILGMINLRGKVVWVCDLGQFLGEPTPVNTDRADIPIVAIEHHDIILGAVVDKIGVVAWLEQENLRVAQNVPEHMSRFIKGEWFLPQESNPLQLLNSEEILRPQQWISK